MVALKITISPGLVLAVFVLVTAQAAEYGQNCTTEPCFSNNILDPLFCDPTYKYCRCLDDMFRHAELNRCVSPHGKPCTLQTDDGSAIKTCTDFATCWAEHDTNPSEVEGLCHCDIDAKFDKVSGRCKLMHGSTRCQTSTQCDISASLTCLDGECVCQDKENQVYNEIQEKCLTLVGGSCARELPYPKPECGANMICINDICECLPEFEENENRTCNSIVV